RIEKAGRGNLFVLALCDDKPLPSVPVRIQPLSASTSKIILNPPTVGKYSVYAAYRNIPVNGK
ncbi:unnamed protein product, partial [Didymodactylos carnosus]